ncbi:MAG: helix-turn-helix domain-containing protein [Phycisphaerae bacterium]
MRRRDTVGSGRRSGLGERLRQLRQGRGLSLRDVESLVRRVSVDRAGLISQPYLAQVESGKANSPSLPKLFNLAAVYAVPIEDLIGSLDREKALDRQGELIASRNEKLPEPSPLFFLPSQMDPVDSWVDDRLGETDRGSLVSFRDGDAAHAMIRDTLTMVAVARYAALPAAIPLLIEFGSVALEWKLAGSRGTSAVSLGRGKHWLRLARVLRDWLLYEKRAARELFNDLTEWGLFLPFPPATLTRADLLITFRPGSRPTPFCGKWNLPATLAAGAAWRLVAAAFSYANAALFLRESVHCFFTGDPVDAVWDFVVFDFAMTPYDAALTVDSGAESLGPALSVLHRVFMEQSANAGKGERKDVYAESVERAAAFLDALRAFKIPEDDKPSGRPPRKRGRAIP